jgi:hypothetical protein
LGLLLKYRLIARVLPRSSLCCYLFELQFTKISRICGRFNFSDSDEKYKKWDERTKKKRTKVRKKEHSSTTNKEDKIRMQCKKSTRKRIRRKRNPNVEVE